MGSFYVKFFQAVNVHRQVEIYTNQKYLFANVKLYLSGLEVPFPKELKLLQVPSFQTI